MVILIYVSAGLVAAASGQLDRVLQDCCNGHVVPARHILSNGSYTTVHQNGHPKKLANGLSNGTYYANGNGVHAWASVEGPKDLQLFASILHFSLHQFWHGWLNCIMVARERKSSLLDADCLQGIVLVRWVLVKEPSWISLKAWDSGIRVHLYPLLSANITDLGQKSFYAVYLKERLNVLVA